MSPVAEEQERLLTAPNLVRDCSVASGITRENAYVLQTLTEKGPGGDFWLRNRLLDGMTGAGAAMASERNDGQFGGVPLNTDRWVVWYERFMEWPNTNLDRWQVVGPEIHGPNVSQFPQAILMLEVGPGGKRRLNSNKGLGSVKYYPLYDMVKGQTVTMKMHVRLSTGSDGVIEIWVDGTKKVDIHGPTIAYAIAGSYFKEANYRNADIGGAMTHDFSSLRVYDGDPGGFGGGTPTPAPATDTTKPVVSMPQPIAGNSYKLNAIPVIADAQDLAAAGVEPSGIASTYIGVVGAGGGWEVSAKFDGPGPYAASLNALADAPGQTRRGTAVPGTGHVYMVVTDKAGNEAQIEGFQVALVSPDAPPPPPPTAPPKDSEFHALAVDRANKTLGNLNTLLPRATSDDSKRRVTACIGFQKDIMEAAKTVTPAPDPT